jgi:hypothetical protein
MMKRALAQLLLLLTAFSFAGTAAVAQEFDTVYELRTDGSIRQDTCSGNSCQGLVLLDNNPAATSITSGGGGLFQMHTDGSIWKYTGTPCGFFSCPGWTELDNNSNTKTIVAGGLGGLVYLFQMHFSGSIWQTTGSGWTENDNNSLTTQIIAAGGTLFLCFQGTCPPNIPPLVQLHSDGKIWQYTGTPCNNTGCPGWQMLDDNSLTTKIFGFADGNGGPGSIFQFHSDGSIWKYTGPTCSGNSCPGWQWLANDSSAKQLVAAETSGRIFVLDTNGTIRELTSSGFVTRDTNAATIAIAASDNGLFQLHSDGSIWYLGSSGWVLVDNNTGGKAIAASSFIQTK